MDAAPTDHALLEALREAEPGLPASALVRRPYRYATSAPLEELRVRLEGGAELELIFKDLSRERLIGDAAAVKPLDLHDPDRELAVYREILEPAELGPRLFAAVGSESPRRRWLVIEKVPGVELWQVGELEVWERVAGWLGGFHARFAGEVERLRRLPVPLIEHSADWFRAWRDRAGRSLLVSDDPRARGLLRALEDYEPVVAELVALPRTFVHGELYPANVMVVPEGEPPRICPIDWEMAAVGPGLVDLAALAGGWGAVEGDRLLAAYARGLGGAASPEQLSRGLLPCRLHLALQWIGWSSGWNPPTEHDHDWISEAVATVDRLGLGHGD